MSDPGSQTVYESEVTQVGGQVEAFLGHGLLIFFQTDSPAELHDMSVLHTASIATDGPAPGDTIHLGDNAMKVLGVGSVVRDNLLNLGHLDLKADGRQNFPAMCASGSARSRSLQWETPSGSRVPHIPRGTKP